MELNVVTLSDFTKLGLVIWQKAYDSVPQVMRNSGLFNVVPVSMNNGNTREFSEIDGQEYARVKNESDQASRASIQQGYSKTMAMFRVALDLGISYEMRTQNKYPEVVRRLTNLGRQVANRMDIDLAHRLTFAHSTSYTDMDGRTVDVSVGDTLALGSAVHTVRGSSSTFSNLVSGNPQLSKGALEGAERLISEQTINQFGEKMVMPFDVLWTTDEPVAVNIAREYLQSTAAVEGGNSGVKNVYMGKYRHEIFPRVATLASGAVDTSKRYYWGLASTQYSTAYLGIWEEPRLKTPQEGTNAEDFATDDWNFGARGGYGIATVSAAWLKISKGDGS